MSWGSIKAGQVRWCWRAMEVARVGLQYLVKRSVSASPWRGGAAGRGRGDLAVGALLP